MLLWAAALAFVFVPQTVRCPTAASQGHLVLSNSLGHSQIQEILESPRPYYLICSSVAYIYACIFVYVCTHTYIFGGQIEFVRALVMLLWIQMTDTKYNVKTNQLKLRDWRDKWNLFFFLFLCSITVWVQEMPVALGWKAEGELMSLPLKNIILLVNVTKPTGKNI